MLAFLGDAEIEVRASSRFMGATRGEEAWLAGENWSTPTGLAAGARDGQA